MKLRDLNLSEFNNAFRKMTEPYYKEYLKTVERNPDWMDTMIWGKYEQKFRQRVSNGEITGKQANTRYWIREFRRDINTVGDFIKIAS